MIIWQLVLLLKLYCELCDDLWGHPGINSGVILLLDSLVCMLDFFPLECHIFCNDGFICAQLLVHQLPVGGASLQRGLALVQTAKCWLLEAAGQLVSFPDPVIKKWLLLSWLLHKQKREFSDANLRSENPADVSTECFTFARKKTQAFSWNIGNFFQILSWYQRTLFSLLSGSGNEAIGQLGCMKFTLDNHCTGHGL